MTALFGDDAGVLLRRVAVVRAGRRDRVVRDRDRHDPVGREASQQRVQDRRRRWPRSVAGGTPWTTSLTPMRTVTKSGAEPARAGSSSRMRSAEV